MRYLWAIVCTFLISASTPSLAGGMSGGTGIGGLIEEIAADIQAILKLPCEIDRETVRRLLMRLWVYGEAEVKIGEKTIKIKWKIGHAHDEKGSVDVVEIVGQS